jgi:hypothetical protein
MWMAGFSKAIPSMPSMTSWWESPMPRWRRAPPRAADVVSTWSASTSGWRGYVGITAVPNSMPGISRPATAMMVSASPLKTCGSQARRTPASAASRTAASTASSPFPPTMTPISITGE